MDWDDYGASAPIVDRTTWKTTEVGQTLEGVLTRVEKVQTKFGESVVVDFDEAKMDDVLVGDVNVWPTKGLLNALREAGIEKGDRVKLKLTGLIDTDKGNPFKEFTVEKIEAKDSAGLFG